MEDMTSFRVAGEITDIELKLNPCPLCGRKPELVSYNADSRANPNFKKHFRFVCSHGLADAPSYKTHPYDMVYKCQEEWNNSEFSTGRTYSFRLEKIQEVSHEEFVEFLGKD